MRTASLVIGLLALLCSGPAHAIEGEDDPLEGFNRAMFSFNDGLDRWVLEPVAKGYDVVVPDPARAVLLELLQEPARPHQQRERISAGQAAERRLRPRPLHGQHHDRPRRIPRPCDLLRPRTPRRGLRPDARRVGRAARPVPRDPAPRPDHRPRHGRCRRRFVIDPDLVLPRHRRDRRLARVRHHQLPLARARGRAERPQRFARLLHLRPQWLLATSRNRCCATRRNPTRESDDALYFPDE